MQTKTIFQALILLLVVSLTVAAIYAAEIDEAQDKDSGNTGKIYRSEADKIASVSSCSCGNSQIDALALNPPKSAVNI